MGPEYSFSPATVRIGARTTGSVKLSTVSRSLFMGSEVSLCCGNNCNSHSKNDNSTTSSSSNSSNSNSVTKMEQQPAPTRQYSMAITSAIAKMKELGINFLALDFDQTILDIHTGGRWRDTLEELLPHVRPVFVQLMQAALEQNIQVAIVTFSGQTKMIREVLEHTVGLPAGADLIPIRGGDRSWRYQGEGSHDGKQAHMASAVEELETRQPEIKISKATTLLIDDDRKNIRFALYDGTRAIWLNPDKPHKLLPDILKLV